jgi:putative ABC transport system permease protein
VRAFLNAVKTGLAEIRLHKMRSVLSFMAIAVGSVVFIDSFSAIVATYDRLQKQKEISGIARLEISQNNDLVFSNPDTYTPPPAITFEDVVRLRNALPQLYMVSPEARGWHNVLEYGGRRVVTVLTGVTPEWAKRDFTYTLKGRFLDWRDIEKKLKVCVIVKKAVPPPPGGFFVTWRKIWDSYMNGFDVLVSHNDLLGRTVLLDGFTFTVVGILEEIPESRRTAVLMPRDQERYKVLAPITTLTHYKYIDEEDSVDVSVDTGDERTFEESMKQIENFLKVRFGDSNYFEIDNTMENINEKIAASMKDSLMTISLGMLAFLAGGIGIMNVTLATVFARIKEIGIRRAVGASRGDIMMQFIVEAAMLGLIGGILGSILGYLWGVQVKVMLGMEASPIKLWMPAVSVVIAALTAFLFAIYPAWVAASLKPADALRTE